MSVGPLQRGKAVTGLLERDCKTRGNSVYIVAHTLGCAKEHLVRHEKSGRKIVGKFDVASRQTRSLRDTAARRQFVQQVF